jgi:hypothetical protein
MAQQREVETRYVGKSRSVQRRLIAQRGCRHCFCQKLSPEDSKEISGRDYTHVHRCCLCNKSWISYEPAGV